ncbi:quinate permease [Grosmannia clavigera kw1407]|uniref:Quinate permease n=1 Tax=Grosmannia clavigera (strain kw1407 / UAMH 11150) TaxID=655863 RepID=F0XPK4_GROCL|nr:quinate permease [Grosmannia clavigera kw1407]EFX00680.1 quinate permease [Grosmannia clavigera kw1407]
MAFFENYRVYVLASVAYLGSFLFAVLTASRGYDTGVMGSVLALTSFRRDFGLPTQKSAFSTSRNAAISANVVSLLTAGCFFGSIAAAFLNDRFGRRRTLVFFILWFLLGAAVQTGARHSIGQIYAGRVLAGIGVGGMSAVTPVFVTENAPARLRGRIAGLFQEFFVIGSTFAYWLDYGVALHVPAGTRQWRIPVALQLVPGALMLVGLCFLKESPRWLVRAGRHDEALASLAYIRNRPADDVDVVRELAEIRASLDEELAATEGVTWRECLLVPQNRLRFLLAFIFESIGVSSTHASLFATGIYGTVKVVTTAIFLLVGIDFWGRRISLICGAVWMAAMMFIIGAVLHTHPPDTSSSVVSPASQAMAAMIYLFVIGYSASWGPTPWVFVSEIFPTRLRPYGVGLAATTQWLFNFVVTEFTPSAVSNIGYRVFIMFGVFSVANALFAFFLVKETKGRSLEDIDILFGNVSEEQRRADVDQVLHKAGADHVDDKAVELGPAESRV